MGMSENRVPLNPLINHHYPIAIATKPEGYTSFSDMSNPMKSPNPSQSQSITIFVGQLPWKAIVRMRKMMINVRPQVVLATRPKLRVPGLQRATGPSRANSEEAGLAMSMLQEMLGFAEKWHRWIYRNMYICNTVYVYMILHDHMEIVVATMNQQIFVKTSVRFHTECVFYTMICSKQNPNHMSFVPRKIGNFTHRHLPKPTWDVSIRNDPNEGPFASW